jgi:dolichol-phosphate mannosyltransferase
MSDAISILIPTYNEKDNIVPLVKRLHSVLSRFHYEILFIDDNSSDGTIETASALSAEYPVKILVRKARED